MRQYTALDLLRFYKFAQKSKLKGVKLIGGYNKEFPELTSKQKLLNLAKGLNMPELYEAISKKK